MAIRTTEISMAVVQLMINLRNSAAARKLHFLLLVLGVLDVRRGAKAPHLTRVTAFFTTALRTEI